jgi:hypothetical protein
MSDEVDPGTGGTEEAAGGLMCDEFCPRDDCPHGLCKVGKRGHDGPHVCNECGHNWT